MDQSQDAAIRLAAVERRSDTEHEAHRCRLEDAALRIDQRRLAFAAGSEARAWSLPAAPERRYGPRLVKQRLHPDFRIHVSDALLAINDGPMLEQIKAVAGRSIRLPRRLIDRPDRNRLAERFDRFRAAV